ncbi:MAG: bifunctional diguanylate cyclase/phosphodiesterase [Acidimicrobiales bacterium]|nr:MAG: bifunctional diguanylate cyclase/phosphodiesterase [Acidimicrobiales bacterium]
MDSALRDALENWRPPAGGDASADDWFPRIFEEAPFGIAAVDFEGNFIRVNRACCELHGRSREELEGMNALDLSDAAERASIERQLSLGASGEAESYRGEFVIRRPDGTSRTALVTASVVHDSDSKPAFILVEYHDVTATREAERRAEEASEALEVTFDNAPVAIFSFSPTAEVLTWNDEATRLFGWTAAETVGSRLPFCGNETDAAEIDLVIKEVRDSNSAPAREVRLHRRDGSALDVLVSAAATHETDGSLRSFVFFAQDVTAQREASRRLAASEKRLRTIVEHIADTVTVVDATGAVLFSTGQYTDVLGYPPEWWASHNAFEVVHPDDRDRALELFRSVLEEPGKEVTAQLRAVRADGTVVPIEAVAVNLLHEPGVRGVVITTRNLSELRRLTELLADEAKVLAAIADDRPMDEIFDAVAGLVQKNSGYEAHCAVITIEDGVCRIRAGRGIPDELRRAVDGAPPFGPIAKVLRTRDTVVTPDVAKDPDSRQLLRRARRFGIISGWTAPIIEPRTDDLVGVVTTWYPHPGEPDQHELRVGLRAAHLLAIALERSRAMEELRHRALHDDLTGLPNRRMIVQQIEEALRAAGSRRDVAVVVMDLDHFKTINDSVGHAVGDELLRTLARRLEASCRPGEMVGRLSADEFAVVATGVPSLGDVAALVNRIELALADPFGLPVGEVYLTASIGVAHAAESEGEALLLLEQADVALAEAKSQGRGHVAAFDRRLRQRARARLDLERELHEALEKRQMTVWFQPKVDLKTGRVVGAEALARWVHPRRGLVLPDQFIRFAEDIGLIARLGRFVFEQAVESCAALARRHHLDDFVLAVNFSPKQILTRDLIANVGRVLLQNSWPAHQLAVEITETALVDDSEAALEAIGRLKEMGVLVSVDDFGTGYSSLGYLHRFPVDIVKIDRSFVSAIYEDGGGSPVLQAVLHMADALGLKTCAEGVELRRQLEGLRKLGCDWAQGFIFSPAVPPDEFEKFVESPFRLDQLVDQG